MTPRKQYGRNSSGSIVRLRGCDRARKPASRFKAGFAFPDSGFSKLLIYDLLAHGRRTAMGKPHPIELRARVVA
ncbi:hypothetical protein, partial [Hoeflea sp.]|uniref:hypothetical protein n=1 Tax=Hoeflea sp. TaxID=1940281 RepID=UPI003A95504B